MWLKKLNDTEYIYPFIYSGILNGIAIPIDDIDTLSTYGVYTVHRTQPPVSPYTHKVEEGPPVIGSNGYQQSWIISEKSAEELETSRKEQEGYVLGIRNRLLSDTDWTQLKDIPEYTSVPYVDYRQALRDITLQPNYPWDIVWPELPE